MHFRPPRHYAAHRPHPRNATFHLEPPASTIARMHNDLPLDRRLDWRDAQSLAGEPMEFFPEPAGAAVAVRVIDVSAGPPVAGMIQFRLLFQGPAAPRYPQRTYLFRHGRLGDYAFFITLVHAAADGAQYEACFSHAD